MEKMNISDIDVSLEHGILLNKNKFLLLYFGIVSAFLLPLITVISIVLWATGVVEWNSDMTLIFILCNTILFAPLAFLCLYILIRDKKLKNKIKIWLEDAIQITADTKTIDIWQPLFYHPKDAKIEVKFYIDKKRYIRISAGKAIGGKK